jgi:hypothetical protein
MIKSSSALLQNKINLVRQVYKYKEVTAHSLCPAKAV